MNREDFVKFYFENKQKNGFLKLQKVAKHFKFKNLDESSMVLPTFYDVNGKNFLKYVYMSRELDAEVLCIGRGW